MYIYTHTIISSITSDPVATIATTTCITRPSFHRLLSSLPPSLLSVTHGSHASVFIQVVVGGWVIYFTQESPPGVWWGQDRSRKSNDKSLSESVCSILGSFKGATARAHLFLKIMVVERVLKDRRGDYVLHMSELTGEVNIQAVQNVPSAICPQPKWVGFHRKDECRQFAFRWSG